MTLTTTTQNKPIIIAIDGLSSCGKSTLAKDLAQRLHYTYIDTGAMYRAVTWHMLQKGLDPHTLVRKLPRLNLAFKCVEGENRLFLNGQDITDKIRSKEVNRHVSEVSKIPEVRNFLVSKQQAMGRSKGIVMDGRDIGTVVFPEAEVKFFLTARPEIRAARRYKEYSDRGVETTIEEVLANIEYRDHTDSTREMSPLKKAPDAISIDTSQLTRTSQLDKALQFIRDYWDKQG